MFRRNFTASLIVLVLFSISLAGCSADKASLNQIPVSSDLSSTWVKIDEPDKAGFSTEKLKALREHLSTLNTTSMMVIYKGKVLFDYGDTRRVSYVASVRKSVLSMIYGIYVNKGKIDLNKTLKDLDIDDVGGLSPLEKSAKVKHLISARSGVYHAASNSGDSLAHAPERGSKKPGTYYLYSNWDFNAAGTVFEKMTGKNIFDVVHEELAKPLGMQDFDRSKHRKGGNMERSVHHSYHMHFSTRDMARLGQLMLNKGRHRGKQIIPAKWIKESTSAITPSEEMNPGYYRDGELGYGYMWWVWARKDVRKELKGAYSASGAYGQYITVIPSMKLVIAHKVAVPPRKSVHWNTYRRVVGLVIDSKVNKKRTSMFTEKSIADK